MIFFLIPRVFKYFIFSFFEGWFVSVGEFFYNLLASEGVLSSLQFGFSALLTLLVATGISLYESRKDPEYEIDKTVISKVFDLKWLLFSLVIAIVLIFSFNNDSATAVTEINFLIVLALLFPFGYLIWVNYRVIDCLADLKKYRKKYLRENTNGQVLDFWEEYFKRLGEQKNNKFKTLKERELYKFKEEESDYIKLLFQKIDKLDFTKDAKFAADLIQVFLSGFENVNFEIFFYEGWILDKLLEWHKKSWWIYYTEIIKNDKDNINLHNNSYLQRVLMDLINKILEKSLTSAGLSSHIFSKLIKKIDKHIEENGELTVEKKVANQLKKYHYINNQNFDFHNTLLNNLHKSNFLREIKSENSEYYFPQKWIITESRNLINNYWLEILFNHWLFEKLHWGNLNANFDEETKEQVKAVIEVFFRDIECNWFLEAILYWRMFLPTKGFAPENLTRKDKIKTLLNVKLNYPEFYYWGKTRVYTFRKEDINDPNYVSPEEDLRERQKIDDEKDLKEQADNTIKLILQLFPEVKNNITQDLQEIKTLKKDKTLTDTQKRRLQIIEQIWQKIEALKTKT